MITDQDTDFEVKYIVYYRGGGKSLFESSYLDSAERFVSKLESENIWNGRPYEEKYEITKVKKPKLLKQKGGIF